MFKLVGTGITLVGAMAIVIAGALLIDFFDPDGMQVDPLLIGAICILGFFGFLLGLYITDYEEWRDFEEECDALKDWRVAPNE